MNMDTIFSVGTFFEFILARLIYIIICPSNIRPKVRQFVRQRYILRMESSGVGNSGKNKFKNMGKPKKWYPNIKMNIFLDHT